MKHFFATIAALVALAVILFGLTLAVVYVAGNLSRTATASPIRVDRSDACSMSQEFVSRNLKAPATAVYPPWTEANCQANHDGDVWTVVSYVDSQNGFGAMIRSNYGVEMRHHPDNDSWTLLDIAITAR